MLAIDTAVRPKIEEDEFSLEILHLDGARRIDPFGFGGELGHGQAGREGRCARLRTLPYDRAGRMAYDDQGGQGHAQTSDSSQFHGHYSQIAQMRPELANRPLSHETADAVLAQPGTPLKKLQTYPVTGLGKVHEKTCCDAAKLAEKPKDPA